VIFLIDKNIDYDDGGRLFKNGEMIFLNRSTESVESHIHAHDYIEIAYVASGKGIHLIGGNEFSVTKGDLFIINYDIPHEFRSIDNSKDGSVVVYNCVFRPEFIDKSLINSRCFSDITHIFLLSSLLDEAVSNDIKLLGNDNEEIEELYKKMYLEYSFKEYGYIEILRAYLLELLIKIFRLYRKSDTTESRSRDRKYFDHVIRFMKQHYNKDIKLEELASMAFLSRNYFCSCFKECTGVTVLEYIQELRINEACSLLKSNDRKIVDIAECVGYKDIKFFNKIFKKIIGKSPSEYRNLYR
jgi:AraC-like DNA-binding protein